MNQKTTTSALVELAGDEDPVVLIQKAKQLPMTMDRVRVVPGMELFYIYDPHHGLPSWVGFAQSKTHPRYCYSTREAAEAARGAKHG